jgi:hypothetical protein
MSPATAFPIVEVPHDPLLKLDALIEPTPSAVLQLRKQIYDNARAIPTILAGGAHGHLGLVMPAAAYQALGPAQPYNMPPLPDVPPYADAESPEQRVAWEAHYKADLRDYNDAHGLHLQLKKQFLAAVPHCYIHRFNDRVHGFSMASLRDMLAHLVDTYGVIDQDALEENLTRLATPWDPTTNIVEVFTRGADCRAFAEDGNEPIADSKYMRVLLQVFKDSGVLTRAIEAWQTKLPAEQTVEAMETHFTLFNKRRRKDDEGMKATLLANAATDVKTGTVNVLQAGWKYCWSHGLCNHTGTNCNTPSPGHVPDATWENLMLHGGCTYIQRPNGFKPVWKPKNNPRQRDRRATDRTKDTAKDADKGKDKDTKTPTKPKENKE